MLIQQIEDKYLYQDKIGFFTILEDTTTRKNKIIRLYPLEHYVALGTIALLTTIRRPSSLTEDIGSWYKVDYGNIAGRVKYQDSFVVYRCKNLYGMSIIPEEVFLFFKDKEDADIHAVS